MIIFQKFKKGIYEIYLCCLIYPKQTALRNIYYFNPTCELAVANGSFSYQPPLLLQEMEKDLAILPFVFGNENDYILTEDKPSPEFQEKIKRAGFDLPDFCSLPELEAMPDKSFEAIYPWGWSPAAHFKFKRLKEKCRPKFKNSPVFNWHNEYRLLFERATSLAFLNDLLERNPLDCLVSKNMTGKKVNKCDEIESLLTNYSSLVLKAPLSSSGRGIQIIRRTNLNTANKQWISGILKQQNYLIAEPFLEKVTDLSFQFRIGTDSQIEFMGVSFFMTNTNGQYKSTLINPKLGQLLKTENIQEIKEMIEQTAHLVLQALKGSVYAKYHRGFLGIDAMVFKDGEKLLMQPCIEVNSRMNMGILTMLIQKRIHPEATGRFELFYGKPGDFRRYNNELSKPEFQDGQLFSGVLPLVESGMQNKFGAYIELDGRK